MKSTVSTVVSVMAICVMFGMVGPSITYAATLSFQPHVTYAVSAHSYPSPYSVVTGDYNGDGKLDIAVANQVPSTVSVLLGNDDGTFGAFTEFPVGQTGPFFMVARDLNGDTIADLVVANTDNNYTVSALLGNGDGTFQVAKSFPIDSIPSLIAVGDVNSDTIPDVVVPLYNTDHVALLLGNGDGTFASSTAVTVGTGSQSVAIADLNHDGKADLAVAHNTPNTVSVLLGNGNGTFGAPTDLFLASNASFVAIRDLNNDNNADLAVTTGAARGVSVLLGNGNGTFGTATNFPVVGYPPTSLQIADINTDGTLDFVTSNQFTQDVSVLLGNGNGTFAAASVFPVGTSPSTVSVGDLNADGKVDIVAANTGSHNVSVLLNDSTTGGGGTPPPTTFQPDVDGYGFRNRGNTPFSYATKRDLFSRVYGMGVFNPLFSTSTNMWIESASSDPFFGTDGNCFGMALSASKEFSGITQYVVDGVTLVSTSTTPRPPLANPNDEVTSKWSGEPFTSDSTLGHIAPDQIAQLGLSSTVSIGEFVTSATPSDYLFSMSGMVDGVKKAHTVLPYKVENGGQAGEYIVYVYDPSYAASTTRKITLVESQPNEWYGQFKIIENSSDYPNGVWWSLTSTSMEISPVANYIYDATHPLLLSPFITVANAYAVLESSTGQQTGLLPGTELNEIPDITTYIPSGSVLDTTSSPAMMFRGNMWQEMHLHTTPVVPNGPVSIFRALPDSYIAADMQGESDLEINGDNTHITVASTTGAYTINLGKLVNEQSKTLHILGTSEGLASTHAFSLDWSDTATPITEKIDADGDGTFEKEQYRNADGVIIDITAPEATIAFSTSTKRIGIHGTDDVSVPKIVTTATSTRITDAAGNSLVLNISKNITQTNNAALVIPSFAYSTGTTTNATTSLRYFWSTDSAGKYTLFISAIRTPTERFIALYVPMLNKTYVVSSTPNDDTIDLSMRTALLLLRNKIKTFNGLMIPYVSTSQGSVIVNYSR